MADYRGVKSGNRSFQVLSQEIEVVRHRSMDPEIKNQKYIDKDAVHILVKACTLVSTELLALGNLYYLTSADSAQMAYSGTQGYVRAGAGAPADSEREIFRLTPDHYEKIVDYLEEPEHFAAIVGGGRKTTVGKKYGSKATVFKAMLVVIQHHGFPMQITSANLQKRFQRYVKKYKDAREFKLDTGGGLTEEEIAAGLTLAVKLERICPHFERMHALYGARPNIAVPVIGDVGVEEDEIVQKGDGGENGDLDEDSDAENNNPNTPRTVNQDGVPAVTPSTLRNHTIDTEFWAGVEDMACQEPNGMPVHSPSCICNECGNFPGVHTGETGPVATEILGGDTEPPSQRSMSANNGPAKSRTPPTKKATKTPAQAAKDASASSKPSFTAIYAERIKEKADYRKELIQSRDKWKGQELEERRMQRLETHNQELLQGRLARRHQMQLEIAAAETARKKARMEYEQAVELHTSKMWAEHRHTKEMAQASRKTALLTTLFGSSKSAAEIKDLLPIIETVDQ